MSQNHGTGPGALRGAGDLSQVSWASRLLGEALGLGQVSAGERQGPRLGLTLLALLL